MKKTKIVTVTLAGDERELWPDRTVVEVKDENGKWTAWPR